MPDNDTWDIAAADFDDAPDHGLGNPTVRDAWTTLLHEYLPPLPGSVLDLGCGTGSLSLVLCDMGYHVTGIDASPAMLTRARSKMGAAGHEARFHLMDAEYPHLEEGPFDMVLARHVLWLFADPAAVVERWLNLVRPGGRLLLIEGFWHTQVGLQGRDVLAMLEPLGGTATLTPIEHRTDLWGTPVTDERYVVAFDRAG